MSNFTKAELEQQVIALESKVSILTNALGAFEIIHPDRRSSLLAQLIDDAKAALLKAKEVK